MKYSLLAGLSLLGSAFASVPPIVTKGSKFFYSNNGTEFFIRGVAYQADYLGAVSGGSGNSYVDPLADPESCMRDIPYLVGLRTNVVRVYAIDPTKNHDACMNALANAGIYVISDLSSPSEAIISQDPMWNAELFTRYAQVVDALQKYPNVIGFFGGNEVANTPATTSAMAFVKAAVRDMKAYISQQGYRSSLGIGYATADVSSIRMDLAQYLVCDDVASSIDFFGYNIYEWCGDSSYVTSGYQARTEEFKNYPVPAFFSEYGCNTPRPRHFTETEALFTPPMTDVWSGGIVYMYFETSNEYGLVSVQGNSVSTLPDYSYLSVQMESATPSGVNENAYQPVATVEPCPSVGANWQASSELPPSPDATLCDCMYDTLECVPVDSISNKLYQKTFSYLGGEGAIDGVTGNGTTGQYGAYSMCNADQRLAFAMNYYYTTKGNKSPKACNFGGAATLKSSTPASGACATQMSSIGPAGTNSVAGGGNLAVSTASGSAGSSSSKGAAGFTAPQAVHVGSWHAGAYMVAAVASGLFMIML